MQWKLVHVVAVVVALAAGWVLRGAMEGDREETGEAGRPVLSEPETEVETGTPSPAEPRPVKSLVDAESTYLVVGRGGTEAGDALWVLSGKEVPAIEPATGTIVAFEQIRFDGVCPKWPECIPCTDEDPQKCPVPKPPPPPPGIALELDSGALGFDFSSLQRMPQEPAGE